MFLLREAGRLPKGGAAAAACLTLYAVALLDHCVPSCLELCFLRSEMRSHFCNKAHSVDCLLASAAISYLHPSESSSAHDFDELQPFFL